MLGLNLIFSGIAFTSLATAAQPLAAGTTPGGSRAI